MMSLVGIFAIIVLCGLSLAIALAIGWAINREREDRQRRGATSGRRRSRSDARDYVEELRRRRKSRRP